MIHQFNSFDDSLHCFVECDVEPPGHALVEPGVAVPQLAVVWVHLEKLVAESEEKTNKKSNLKIIQHWIVRGIEQAHGKSSVGNKK